LRVNEQVEQGEEKGKESKAERERERGISGEDSRGRDTVENRDKI